MPLVTGHKSMGWLLYVPLWLPKVAETSGTSVKIPVHFLGSPGGGKLGHLGPAQACAISTNRN